MHLSEQYDLPRFFFTYDPDGAGPPACDSPLLSVDGLNVCMSDYLIGCRHQVTERSVSVVLGHPVVGEQIDFPAVLRALDRGVTPEFLRELNGEFLLVHLDRAERRLSVTTDRFPSIPVYYAVRGGVLAGSVFYNDLWNWLGQNGGVSKNPGAFLEFVWFQRLFGTKTYDADSICLPGATTLDFADGRADQRKYWTHDFTKTGRSLDDCAHDLAGLLRTSIRRKTSDGPARYGLFLSGGKDSRSVYGSFDEPPACFTLTPGLNNEFHSAAEAVAVRDGRHVHLELPDDPYSHKIDLLTQLSGGMYAFDHALFHGYREEVRRHADVVFHGHGIDYMFQGMYVPSKVVRLWGKTEWRSLKRFSGDIVGDFISNVSYKVKVVNPLDFVLQSRREELHQTVRDSLGEVVRAGEGFCNTPHDVWEWLLFHSIARHYPYTNLYSIGTCAEQRTPTFDKDIFDFYLSLPAKHRLNARLAIKLLTVISPELAAIRNNNTGMPASYQAWQREFFIVRHRFRKKLGLMRKNPFNKSDADRTWPHRLDLLQARGTLYDAAIEMSRSEALAELGIWDMDKLGTCIPDFIDNPPHRHIGGIIFYLLTIDRFLRQ